MKYILMMTGTKAGVESYHSWRESDIKTHFAFLKKFNEDLVQSSELVDVMPLGGPQQAVVVHAGKDGVPVTDGVFPESKEFLLGAWIVDVDSRDRAIALAARLSAGPGPDGITLSMPIEVHQIMESKTAELE